MSSPSCTTSVTCIALALLACSATVATTRRKEADLWLKWCSENAIEQGKDEAISDAIRAQYKTATGSVSPLHFVRRWLRRCRGEGFGRVALALPPRADANCPPFTSRRTSPSRKLPIDGR